ncbi:hemerythrin domain-containing protein [Pontibacter sp. SGAir0037]|uniref:hemerythrin domain-containing protein n=1 Tax=Pontibacter sp. SGAir0037 TaxID=2571030 RepID=UPI0010CCFB31|nr:hemerythrin domain-containing protein [Pontibacter sp. SGAir0037]QCR22476.1 hypothetical protein C1N53_09100 [Pontibacter sp. SGAir0037]
MKRATTPLKRDKSLVPLSREHHFGLLFCWKLRQGLQNGTDLEVLREYVQYFWDHVLKAHCEEEEWLLNRLVPENETPRLQLEEEHHLLHEIIDCICQGNRLTRELFEVLQQDLEEHIRWEERHLYPYLQAVTHSDQLELTGQLLAHKHTDKQDSFPISFWEKPSKTA